MASNVRLSSCLLWVLAGAVGAFAGCGGGGSGGGGAGSGGSGGTSGSEPGLPSRLPEDQADCASATGADGCFFDACCTELVACSDNADCATTYACYLSCPSDDSDCFLNCVGSSFENGGEDFGIAMTCAAPAGLTCGGVQPGGGGGSGGSGGSGGGGEGGEGGTPPTVGPLGTAQDDFGWNLLVSDDPLTAELTLDDERAVSEEVTDDGATLTATAEDGTVFELTIPEGALYGPTVITMTPLLSFGAAPLEGDAYGVQIEPDGLSLMASPTLAITPPDGVEWPVDQQIPLAVNGADDTVSLALLDPESEPIHLVLNHFSSYAVLLSQKGYDSTLSEGEIRSRFGGDVEARVQSAASERLGRTRQSGLLGVTPGNFDEAGLTELVAEFEEHVIKPRILMAGESCAAGRLAMSTLIGATRQLGLLYGDGTLDRVIALLPTVANVCLSEEYEICRDEHIITRILPIFNSIVRQMKQLGLGSTVGGAFIPPTWVIEAEEYVKKCLRFELQFDSSVTYTSDTPATTMSETVTARVPVSLMATLATLPAEGLPLQAAAMGGLILGGPAPMESSAYSVATSEQCRSVDQEIPADGELYVGFLVFGPAANSPSTPGGSPEVAAVGVSVGIVQNLSGYAYTEQVEEQIGCGDVLDTGTATLSWGTTLGGYLLEVTADQDSGAFLDDWNPVNGDIIATKDLTLSDAEVGSSTSGPVGLVLFHTPE